MNSGHGSAAVPITLSALAPGQAPRPASWPPLAVTEFLRGGDVKAATRSLHQVRVIMTMTIEW